MFHPFLESLRKILKKASKKMMKHRILAKPYSSLKNTCNNILVEVQRVCDPSAISGKKIIKCFSKNPKRALCSKSLSSNKLNSKVLQTWDEIDQIPKLTL